MTPAGHFGSGPIQPGRNPELEWVEETRREIEAQRRARGLPVHPHRTANQGGTSS